MPELDDIYSDEILTIAANMPAAPPLEAPDASATAHSKLCGSTITVDLKAEDNVVTGYGHRVKACLLGQTAAAIMAKNIVGSTFDELREVRKQMHAMLKEGGPAPSGRWAELRVLAPVRNFRTRQASTLLVFEAVNQAIEQIENKRAETAA